MTTMNKQHIIQTLKITACAMTSFATLAAAHAASIMDRAAPQPAAPILAAPLQINETPEPTRAPAAQPAEEATLASAPVSADLDRIVAVVNSDVITEYELEQRVHTVAINLRRQNIQLPPMDALRQQVLERLITERAILQRARQTGIRVDDQMVNASIEQIARQNNLTVDELSQKLLADGVTFSAFRNEIRDEITTQRLRAREVDEKIDIPESEVDAYLAQQAGFTGSDVMEYHVAQILLPVQTAAEDAQVRQTADSIADRARKGEDFSQLAAAYSRSNDALEGGDMGWLAQQDIPAPFWEAMRGHIDSGAVYIARSQHAYHVVKLLARRNGVEAKLAGGPVVRTHARHILMFVSDITPEADVIRRLNDIKHRVETGQADFATMARLNSVDATATRGGDLGWLQAGDTVPEFEAAMNKLQPGQISDPIKTNYGYHLIQIVERRTDKEGNPERMRIAARQNLRQKKLAEATYNWQRELRDEAFVDIRDPALRPRQ